MYRNWELQGSYTRSEAERAAEEFWTIDVRLAKELFNDGTIQIDQDVAEVISGTRRFGRRYQIGLRLAF